jgi:hypothetical protein|tara:strand:+ start:377 stop:607 length:231 start_codon:yes stop_codon:yes gene_type:complete
MRVRDFQQVLGKFTDNEKGTIISDCPIYIETMDGRLEEIRKVELQESRLINSPEPARVVIKAEATKRFMSPTFKQS